MKVLRPYQSDAVDSVIREWDRVRSTAIICATGTGKSTMGTEVVRRRIPFGRVLWLAHRDELISQARDTIAAMIPEASVGVEQAGSYARVTGFDSLADDVVVASVATLHDKRRSRFDPSRFATIVCDEIHHGTSRTYREIFAHFQNAKLLGLTATPDRGDGVGLGEVIESVAYEYDLQTAIREGYLCPIKAIMVDVAGLDLSSVRTTAGDLNQGQLAKLLEVDRVHHEIASPLVQHAGDRQTIVFATSVEQSKALADVIQGYLSGTGKEVRHLDGTTPAETRKRILREYGSGKVQFLCNVGVLTEGFDAPATSCVALARPTKSRALYAQMVGRGTRLAPGKQDCIAEGSMVLTDRGMVPIEEIDIDMRVWDGVEFVEHMGAICKGEADVIEYAGVVGTSDHRIWTGSGWKTLAQCAAEQAPVCITGFHGAPVREADGYFRSCNPSEWDSVHGDEVRLRHCRAEELLQPSQGDSRVQILRESAGDTKVAVPSMRVGQAEMYEPKIECLSQVRRERDCLRVPFGLGHGPVDHVAPWSRQESRDRQNRQRQGIRAREYTSGHEECEHVQYKEAKAHPRNASVQGSSSTHPIRRQHVGSPDSVGDVVGCDCGSVQSPIVQAKRRVWDILNAGPRHRFTVNGVLVSNCLVIDFRGSAGKHSLANPVDLLAGKSLPDEVRAIAMEKAKDGKLLDAEAMEEAEQEHAKRLEEADRKRAAAAALQVVAIAKVEAMDLFRASCDPGAPKTKRMVTDGQRRTLLQMGLKADQIDRMTFDQASRQIDSNIQRRKKGLCTYPMARTLAKNGMNPDLDFQTARNVLDALKANQWRATGELLAQYGARR